MKSGKTIYGYQIPPLAMNNLTGCGEVLASKTAQIKMEDGSVKIAVVFMRIPLETLASELEKKCSAFHSYKKTEAHLRKLLLSREENTRAAVDNFLRNAKNKSAESIAITNDLRAKHVQIIKTEQTQKIASVENNLLSGQAQSAEVTHMSVRMPPEETLKTPTLSSGNYSKEEIKKPMPILDSFFTIANEKAINAGKIFRVNDKYEVYTYDPSTIKHIGLEFDGKQREKEAKQAKKNNQPVGSSSPSSKAPPMTSLKLSPTTPQSSPLPEGPADGKRRIELPDISNRPTPPTLPSRTDRPNLTNRPTPPELPSRTDRPNLTNRLQGDE